MTADRSDFHQLTRRLMHVNLGSMKSQVEEAVRFRPALGYDATAYFRPWWLIRDEMMMHLLLVPVQYLTEDGAGKYVGPLMVSLRWAGRWERSMTETVDL